MRTSNRTINTLLAASIAGQVVVKLYDKRRQQLGTPIVLRGDPIVNVVSPLSVAVGIPVGILALRRGPFRSRVAALALLGTYVRATKHFFDASYTSY